jgi:amino acid adenylation domain-containing protein
MLFHALSVPASGVDMEQIIMTLREEVNVAAFELAWNRVLEKHPVLRSKFVWEGLDEPVQVVEKTVSLSPRYVDWGDVPPTELDERLEDFLRKDRVNDFKMTEAPLMRLSVFRTGRPEVKCVWTFHHILLDGRSFPLVLEEVFGLYEALRTGSDVTLPAPRPYRDYIEWLLARDLSADERFWREALAGFTAPTPLPVSPASLGKRELGGEGVEEFRLSTELTSALRSFAGSNGLSLNTLLQGAWSLLLHHYSDEDDIVYGATRACRRTAIEGADAMIGLFINTLPVRVKLSPDQTVLSLLKSVREQHVRIRPYEHSPLHKVQQWSSVPPGTSLFESLVVFENYLLNSYLRSRGGSWHKREFIYRGRTNYPLTILGYDDAEILIRIEYDEDRFDKDLIRRMAGHMRMLLTQMAACPEKKVSEIGITTEEEHRQIVVEWNDTARDYPTHRCLHELFEAQVERTPDHTALLYGDRRLTYGELNARANQLGRVLRSAGVGPEVPVGVFMERSPEMVISLYGILKAGGAYVPLDPEYPHERVAFMLEDTKVPVILTQKHLLGSIPASTARTLCVDDEWPAIARESSDNLDSGVRADNLAYIIFTSGSTGRPKGAMNEHRGIVNRLVWMQEEYRLNASDRVIQKTPYSFDVSVWEFFWPLLYGATLVVARPGGHRDSAYLVQTIVDHCITTIHFVPSMLQIFLEDRNVGNCRSLKRVICSGEALPYELQERFFNLLDAELHNLYGPTEAAVDVTYWACRRNSDLHLVPIGRPVANTQTFILNRYMQPVPIGIPGELYLGGIQVGRGYMNRPDLTAEKFIPDPFRQEPGARLYKTGDLCRYLPDGNVEYIGRTDFQVKIRGLRIELGEIEFVIGQHPDIREAVVIAREEGGDKRLVAYLIARDGKTVNVDELRGHLKDKLADYMIPSAFMQMEFFPLTSSGKVDRRALPVPEGKRQIETVFVAPEGEIEKAIATIWKDVLKLEKVGTQDNFFDLGGHSLLLVRVMNRIQQSLGKEIGIVDMFQRPTIRDLAKFLREDRKDEPSSDAIEDRAARQRATLQRQKKGRPGSGTIQ